MELKKRKPKREKFIGLRVTMAEYNKIKMNANLYTAGNISEWIAVASTKYRPLGKDIK